MNYQVLARKWRPRSFKELVGQNHVLQTLINALNQNMVHHAYLFTGTRGVGKTSIARILVKCLNCEYGVSSTPCGQCSACCEIDDGCFIDLIEVDAASRTKVEDIRELLENVQYTPTRGRYKVYLIDEVHMLSVHSFNALLKTLEEPPPYIKFILATTDPKKIPVTILSRCLQFCLKNITSEKIVEHLQHILEKEHISYEIAALWQLARMADGSIRDSLSLTDQSIAFGNGQIHESDVRTMIGIIDQGQVIKIVYALCSGNVNNVLQTVADLAEYAPDFFIMLDDILTMLHRIAIAQVVPEAVDNSQGDKEQVLELSGKMLAEDVRLYYEVGLVSKRDLPLSPDPRCGFEMAMLRMLAFRTKPVIMNTVQRRNETMTASSIIDFSASNTSTTAKGSKIKSETFRPLIQKKIQNKKNEKKAKAAVTDTVTYAVEATHEQSKISSLTTNINIVKTSNHVASTLTDVFPNKAYTTHCINAKNLIPLIELNSLTWMWVCHSLLLSGITRIITAHCEYVSHCTRRIHLRLDWQKKSLYNESHRQRIEKALVGYFVQPLEVAVTIGTVESETPATWSQRKRAERYEAQNNIFNDRHVQALVKKFSGIILEDSIQSII